MLRDLDILTIPLCLWRKQLDSRILKIQLRRTCHLCQITRFLLLIHSRKVFHIMRARLGPTLLWSYQFYRDCLFRVLHLVPIYIRLQWHLDGAWDNPGLVIVQPQSEASSTSPVLSVWKVHEDTAGSRYLVNMIQLLGVGLLCRCS